jgi:hypothetical protein
VPGYWEAEWAKFMEEMSRPWWDLMFTHEGVVEWGSRTGRRDQWRRMRVLWGRIWIPAPIWGAVSLGLEKGK